MKRYSFLPFLFFVIFAQAQNISLKINIQTEDNKCQSDFTTKKITTQHPIKWINSYLPRQGLPRKDFDYSSWQFA